ncbi:MAG: protein kinase [Planctomycetota bacterium]
MVERTESGSGHAERDAEEARLQRVDAVLTELTERARRGSPLDIEPLLAQHPDLAADVRRALPALVGLERAASTAGDEPQAARDAMPSQIGDFKIVRELGQGGMGTVYEAIEERLGRRVALKLLPPRATRDARYLERFHREARAAARMHHPGIVTVHGFGEVDGAHYYSMQFVEGTSLDRLVAYLAWRDGTGPAPALEAAERTLLDSLTGVLCSGSLSGFDSDDSTKDDSNRPTFGARYHRNVARLVLQAAEAVEYAHARGVLHRDIKPANLLADADGHLYITDFGLAKTDESGDLTRAGDILGTLRYMAPEQFEGHTDARSDVYALGLVLYELLTLRPAFAASHRPRLVHDVLYERPIRPRSLRAEVPQDLERVVRKATSKLAEERYPTARALAEDLRCWLDGRPIAARMPSAWYLARLAVARNRAVIVTAGLAFALIALGVARYVTALSGAEAAQRAAAVRAALAAAESALAVDEVASARDRLAGVPEAHRGWAWRHLDACVDQSAGTLASIGEPVQSLAFVNGDTVVFGRTAMHRVRGGRVVAEAPGPPGAVIVRAARTALGVWVVSDWAGRVWLSEGDLPSFEREPLQLPSTGFGLALTPDGARALVGLFDATIVVIDVAQGVVERTLEGPREHVDGIAVPATGAAAFVGSNDGRLLRYDLRDGSYRELARDLGALHAVATNADASIVAVAGESGLIHLLDGASGASRGLLVGSGATVSCLAISPDGKTLASGGMSQAIRVYDIEDRRPLRVLTGHARRLTSLCFGADSSQLFSGSYAGIAKEWDLDCVGGAVVLGGHIADVVGLAVAPDGRRFATGGRDATIRIWDSASEGLERILLGQPGEVSGLAWGSDGARLVSTCRRGYVLGWEVDSAKSTWRFKADSGVPGRVAIAPGSDECWVPFTDGTLRVFGLSDGALRAELAGLFEGRATTDPLGAVAVGGHVFVGTPSGEVIELDRATRSVVQRAQVHTEFVYAIDVAPNGREIATSSADRTVAIMATGKLAQAERLHIESTEHGGASDGLEGLAYSPDGALLAVASRGGQVRLIELATRTEVLRLSGHRSWVRSVAFLGDGSRLVSTGSEGDVRVWDTITTAQKRALMTPLRSERRRAVALAQRLGVALDQWDTAPAALAALPLDAASRSLALSEVHARMGRRASLVDVAWEGLLQNDAPESWRSALQLNEAISRTNRHSSATRLLGTAASVRLGDLQAAVLALTLWSRVTGYGQAPASAGATGWSDTPLVGRALAARIGTTNFGPDAAAAEALRRELTGEAAVPNKDAARALAILDWPVE